jgi:hypothetical protein
MIYSLPYFQRSYKDDDYLSSISKKIDDKYYKVYRPNHGLAHSIRQGFLVRDILKLMIFENNWLQNKINEDSLFSIKLAILSSFQRSGRQSEISSSDNQLLYEQYENDDVNNMIYTMSNIQNPYFDSKEIKLWASALKWANHNKSYEIQQISNLINAAHLLDLRRIHGFDATRIKYEISELLNITTNCNTMNLLWDQSGKYLNVCGDRDLVINKNYWSNRFFILHQNPNKLYYSLRSVKL